MSYLCDGVSIKNRRKTNMDGLLLKTKKISGRDICLSVVCDGIGGLKAGGFASSFSIKAFQRWFDSRSTVRNIEEQLKDFVIELNTRIVALARKNGFQTGCTLSALLLVGNLYYIIHTGDSRIYLLEDGQLWKLTQDQSNNGKLTDCIGWTDSPKLLYREGKLKKYGCFLLCSDGLYRRNDIRRFGWELSCANKNNIHEKIERLIRCAIENGEEDNISVAMVIKES